MRPIYTTPPFFGCQPVRHRRPVLKGGNEEIGQDNRVVDEGETRCRAPSTAGSHDRDGVFVPPMPPTTSTLQRNPIIMAVSGKTYRLRRTFMPQFGKWLLTLGLMAATPGMALAANPFSKFFRSKPARSGSAVRTPQGRTNQQVAVEIASALRRAKLNRYEMDVSYINGICTLSGQVGSEAQKAEAARIAKQVPGVQRVENRLRVRTQRSPISPVGYQSSRQAPRVRRAAFSTAKPTARKSIQLIGGESIASPAGQPTASSKVTNQKMAEAVARSLQSAGLNGYDMEIRYQDGVAELRGAVSSPRQRLQAEQAARQVPGVRMVSNQLRVLMPSRSSQGPARSVQPAVGYRGYPMQYAGQPGQPVQYAGQPGQPMPAYAHGGPGAAQATFNNANLPEYAWPSYAHYPNYAQLTYPKQYSASAWPYIGPFYPYPQVPLGWRAAQLEWDDGYWSLNFRPRTDKWWWFLNPKNW